MQAKHFHTRPLCFCHCDFNKSVGVFVFLYRRFLMFPFSPANPTVGVLHTFLQFLRCYFQKINY